MTCDAHFRTRTRDDVCEQCVKFRDNQLRNEVCRAVTPLGHVRMYIRTGRSLHTLRGYNKKATKKGTCLSLHLADITQTFFFFHDMKTLTGEKD